MRHSWCASPFTSLEDENMKGWGDDYLDWFMSSYIRDTKGRCKKTTPWTAGNR